MKLIAFLCLLAAAACADITPEDRLDEGWWKKRFEEKKALIAANDYDLVFIGDSITQGFENAGIDTWRKYYADRNALNLGFSGDRTEHTLWLLEQWDFEKLQPEVAVIMIGSNNTGHKMQNPAEIAEGISQIVQNLRGHLPEAKILLLGIFPRDHSPEGEKRKNNAAVNAILAQSKFPPAVTYLDISEAFLDDNGVMAKEIMPDGLHPKEKGYAIWGDAMEQTLETLLK